MAYGTVNADVIGTSVANSNLGPGNATRFKNRIINGDMRVSERNGSGSVTFASAYNLDRWRGSASQASKGTVQQNAGSVTPPAGFTNYLGFTSSSSYSITSTDYFELLQYIEGYNIADLLQGTVSAKTFTLSFWVRSSLTGTFGGSISNTVDRLYPFSYTISSANTWEYKTVTIPGCTDGTWATTTGKGMWVLFGLGVGSTYSGPAGSWTSSGYESVTGAVSVVGTSGATWYVTGVQIEVGSSATGFDLRDIGTELMLCRRYYQYYPYLSGFSVQPGSSSTYIATSFSFNTPMRVSPTPTFTAPSGGSTGNIEQWGGTTRAVNSYNIGANNLQFVVLSAGITTGDALDFHLTLNAEL